MKSMPSLLALIAALTALMACSPQNASLQNLEPQEAAAIFGGDKVNSDDPVALVTVKLKNKNTDGLCTGVIWDDHLILTAAHCVKGPAQGQMIDFTFANKRVYATKKHVHGGWAALAPTRDRHDLALLYFAEKIPAPYRPAYRLTDFSAVTEGSPATIAGYGMSNKHIKYSSETLRKTQVKIVDTFYSDTTVIFKQNQGSGACYGDSGGPAFYFEKGRYKLFAITSALVSHVNGVTDACDERSIYMRLDAYDLFIAEAEAALQ